MARGRQYIPGWAERPEVTGLARALGVSRFEAVGIIEVLWQRVAQYPTKIRADLVEITVEWRGEKGKLLRTLVERGFVHEGEPPVITAWMFEFVGGPRCRGVAGWITSTIRARVYSRDGHKCVTCGSPGPLTVDHIVPVTRGGRTVMSNLQTLCMSCNSKKGNRGSR